MDRVEYLSKADRIVVKIGSSSIMRTGSRISRDFMDSVAEQIRQLKDGGKEVLLVSSGAIAIGLKTMGVVPKPNEIPIRQAAASVGQSILMQEWGESFRRHGMIVGQVLMTMDTYSDRESAINLNNTIDSLLEHGVVPIFNENDAIRTQEIRFGDNDTLSAIIASRTDADLLVILSDVAGLYDDNPSKNPNAKLIPLVTDLESVRHMAGGSGSSMGTGGMKTKINAAEICRDAGCDMIIALSGEDRVIYRTVTGEDVRALYTKCAETLYRVLCLRLYGVGEQNRADIFSALRYVYRIVLMRCDCTYVGHKSGIAYCYLLATYFSNYSLARYVKYLIGRHS